MTPALLLPGALAALAALILPIIIHIARRSEQQPTDFAALRWLSERPRPRSRLRLDEWPLLVLRLLLLALLALFLAQPILSGANGRQNYVAVVPGADLRQARLSAEEKERAHWLAPGFPFMRDGAVAASQPVGSLMRELDAQLPPEAKLTIVTPSIVQGADGDRPHLSRPVRWTIVPGAMAERPAAVAPPASIAVRYDAAHAGEVRYIRAALTALLPPDRSKLIDVAPVAAPLPRPPAPLIWLSGGSLPPRVSAYVQGGGTALVAADALVPDAGNAIVTLWRDQSSAPLVTEQAFGKGRLLRFTKALRPAAMPTLLEADFPDRLKSLLDPAAVLPARATARAYAPLPGGSRMHVARHLDLQPWLVVAIALLFLAERWLATRRTRAVAP